MPKKRSMWAGTGPVKALPWKTILGAVSKVYVIVTLAGMMVSAVMAGFSGFLGFTLGSVIVYLWFTLDIVVAGKSEKVSMAESARRLMAVYVLKVVLGLVLLLVVPVPQNLLNGWLLTGAILGVSLWLATLMKALTGLRILYFDDHDQEIARRGER